MQGATNWYSPSYNPLTKLFYLTVWENKGLYRKGEAKYMRRQPLHRQRARDRYSGRPRLRRDPRAQSQDRREGLGIQAAHQAVVGRAFDRRRSSCSAAAADGSPAIAKDVESYFFALDAETGKELWRINLGGDMSSSAITYSVNGKQMVTMPAGSAIFTFALP